MFLKGKTRQLKKWRTDGEWKEEKLILSPMKKKAYVEKTDKTLKKKDNEN